MLRQAVAATVTPTAAPVPGPAPLTPPAGLIAHHHNNYITFVMNCVAFDCKSDFAGLSDESLCAPSHLFCTQVPTRDLRSFNIQVSGSGSHPTIPYEVSIKLYTDFISKSLAGICRT